MGRIPRAIGMALVALSALAVLQTAREVVLRQLGDRAYTEELRQERPLAFAGHTITVADDQPVDGTRSQADHDGWIQPLMDGKPLGPPSRARVRRGLADLGRYHLWFDAWVFRDRATGRASLWLARRLQPTDASDPRFEVVTVAPDGARERRVLRAWRLGTDYRLFRATQFVREGAWSAMPLSLGATFGVFPVLLLAFPIGTFFAGVLLMRRGSSARPGRVAG
jgi:hypothetical protein